MTQAAESSQGTSVTVAASASGASASGAASASTAITLAPTPVAPTLTPETIFPEFAKTLAIVHIIEKTLEQYEAVVLRKAADGAAIQLVLTTPEQEAWVNNAAHLAAEYAKALDAERKRQVTPFNELVDKVNGNFMPLIQRAKLVKAECVDALGRYADYKLEARKAAFAEAQVAAAAGDLSAAATAMTVVNQLGGDGPQGTTLKKKWVAKIVNPALVPREWCEPDEQKIRAWAREFGPDETPGAIPGVEFELVNSGTIRSK